MNKVFSLLFVSALALNAQAVEKNDAKYFQLAKVKMIDVTEQYAAQSRNFSQVGVFEDCNNGNKPASNMVPFDGSVNDEPSIDLDPFTQVSVLIDKIVNLGRKVWALVETGRPVVSVETYTANALPMGLRCWTDLTGWQVPQSKVYRVQYENAYGMKVIDFAYRLTFTAGGSLNGQGRYLTNVALMPADLNVSWGFNLNASAEVPSVFNMGTKEQPVAGMQMLMKWNVKTVVSHIEQVENYYVGGDNTMKHLQ